MLLKKLKKINIKEKIKNSFYSTVNFTQSFIAETKNKLKNLYETNYNLGLHHMENGHLWDASFRFKVIKRFYPDKLEAQYKYAMCLVLQGFNKDAENLLTEILEKNPSYSEAIELLENIKNNNTQFIVDEYNEKIKKLAENSEKKEEDKIEDK